MMKHGLAACAVMMFFTGNALAHNNECDWQPAGTSFAVSELSEMTTRDFSVPAVVGTKSVFVWGEWSDPDQGRSGAMGTYYSGTYKSGRASGIIGDPGPIYVLVAMKTPMLVATLNEQYQVRPDKLPPELVAGLCYMSRS